jgi:cyanophycin synthetase
MKIDLGDYEQFPTDKLKGFADRLQKLIPSIYEHECSEKKPGGFLERVRRGTWLGHVAEHVALELQTLAGMPCGYGRTRSASGKGVYHVVFAYQLSSAGIYAGKAAMRIVQALADNTPYDINEDIKELIQLNKREGLGPSTQAIVNEAKKRGIPCRRLDRDSWVQLGQGKNQRTIRSTIAGTTSNVAVDLVADKADTKELLVQESIPVPKGITFSREASLEEVIEEIGFPLVIKPLDGNHGRGITTNIQNKEEALRAFQLAKEISNSVIAERFIEGSDFRFLVINYKLVAAAKRIPAMIIGDGVSTIEELIGRTNSNPARGEGHEKVLTTIKLDNTTLSILARNQLSSDAILENGHVLFLKDTANISTGGTSEDVTAILHPYNVFLAERIARLLHLNICGIDIVAKDIAVPLNEENGAVLEVNAAPGLRMHLHPSEGMPRNVAEPIIDMLYPDNAPSRIPIVAVTGTNGKTTTTRLTAHIMKEAGHTVGYTTTDGIYINDIPLEHGDCGGPSSAEKVLRDPIVDFAVLECARGGILRSGLGFDKCNTSIITNVTDDHLGLGEIESLKDLAKVKSVVARSTFDKGYAILNADDDLVYEMSKELDCHIALFSINENNKRIKEHCSKGGIVAMVEGGYFTICNNKVNTRVARVDEVPLTLEGKAECMIKNVLPAILAAAVHDVDMDIIRNALRSFIPSASLTPGRMNIFDFRHFRIMLDYAHNRDGFMQLKSFMDKMPATVKIGIITSPGDRRDEDIRNIGACAAEMFDEIIIRHDDDTRGRTPEEISKLITEGIKSVKQDIPINIVSDELQSIQYAMDIAKEGCFIVACIDKVQKCLNYVIKAKGFEDSIHAHEPQVATTQASTI